MQINKEMVLRLYERKDPKRRRILFEYYRSLFEQPCSVLFLIEMINTDLGEDLIIPYDIKYIRSKAPGWIGKAKQTIAQAELPYIQTKPQLPQMNSEPSWTQQEPKPYVNPSKKFKL